MRIKCWCHFCCNFSIALYLPTFLFSKMPHYSEKYEIQDYKCEFSWCKSECCTRLFDDGWSATKFNQISLSTAYICIALWVRSGNRGNLKCLKVNDYFALIWDKKKFISFSSDAKLQNVFDGFLGLITYVKISEVICKKHEGGVRQILCFGQLGHAEKHFGKFSYFHFSTGLNP